MSGRRDDARIFQQGEHSLIPVLLRESVLDSVTFRATTKHFEDQLEAVDIWINAFLKYTRDFTGQLCKLEEQALMFHGRPPPTFIESGVVDSDYTVTAMSRCSDASKAYWSSIFNNARSVEQTVSEPLQRLQHNEMKEIRHLRNDFYKQQKAYDETLRYYSQQSKTKEASSLREDAFQLYEKRKSYIKSSFDYTIKMSTFRAALDSALISAFSRSFEGTANHTSALATDFASRPAMGRIMSWSDSMMESSRFAEEYLYSVRFELEDEINRLVSPPRGLSEYASSPGKKVTTKPNTTPNSIRPSKQGWLMMRCVSGKPARYVWHRRWCYVKDGIFGWLSNNPKTGAVEESDKIGVLLCNVKVPALEDRRFTFEVLTKDATILLQAESDSDVTEWLATFDIVKKAVLAAGHSNEHAFAVTKPQSEFAAAHQALESGHGESPNFDVAPNQSTPLRKNPAASEGTTNHGLGALVAATGIPANLASPRIGSLFSKIEEQKFLNPFEATVEGNDLAPTTFMAAPINTHLTKESLLESSTSIVHGPSGTQANHWGSMNYGMLNITNKDSFEGQGVTKLLAGPEIAVDAVYAVRDRDLAERGLFETNKEFPPDYPHELRKQDAQFCSLFPHARAEHVLMVVRATRSVEGQKAMFSGRIYVTLRGVYFYSQSSGMVLLQTCLFSEILSIRASRKVNYDELSFDIHDVGESTSLLFLDDADLVRKRLEILLANYIADKPKGSLEMLSILQKTLPDNTRVIPHRISKTKASNNSSDEEDEQGSRKEPKVDVVRLKLPSEPVLTEPDEQMLAKVYDTEYMISAKGLFHLLFGNRSPVWLQWYKQSGVVCIRQGAWQTVEDGTLARAFRYKLAYKTGDTTQEIVERTDFQKISKREEHLDYTVIAYRQAWNYPQGSTYLFNVKMNITFVSKTKSRLRMWFDIDWKKPNYLLRGVIIKASGVNFKESLSAFTHHVEREVLDRMGLQSKTSKAVRLYGRVEGHSDTMQVADDTGANTPSTPCVILSPLDLILRFPRAFFLSLLDEFSLLLRYCGSITANFVTANGLLLFLLAVSLLVNTWISGKSSVAYWNHQAATKLLDDIQIAPVGLMSRAITLDQIEQIAYNTTNQVQPVGKCFQTFQNAQNQSQIERGYYRSFKDPRDSLARTRNDLLVAMKVLNGLEVEIVKGQWLQFLETEKRNCLMVADLSLTDPAVFTHDLRVHCENCLQL